jgi:hypothetical protein
MADIQPDRLTTSQSEWKFIISQRPSVLWSSFKTLKQHFLGGTFCLSGNANQHNLRIWGSNSSQEVTECRRDNPEFNLFHILSRQKLTATVVQDSL